MNALELHNVTKRFGEKVIANDHVSLTVRRGEILAVLGENGSGKTTLMNMIAGIYHPDEGEIYVNGQPVTISSPRDAFRCGIGMVHQHFKLVDVFTATENIVLGVEDGKPYRLKEATRRVEEISARYGFEIDAKKKIYAMSVSEKQTVEIVKVLYRGAEILILDEPTAVLTPQETEKLFAVLRRMREDGKSIVIITHKLNEVLSLSDRVTVLHKGRNAGTVNTAETNEAQLTEMMVGQKVVLNIERKTPEDPTDRLIVREVSCLSRDGVQLLDRVTFTARAGEILGIAGIAGSGQRELLEAIAGLQPVTGGEILYEDPKSGETENLRDKTPLQIRELGVRLSFVPEDRLGMGLVSNMDIIDNMMLRSYRRGRSAFLDRQPPRELAERRSRCRHPQCHHPCPPSFRRQCAKGTGRPRDRLGAYRAYGRLPRPRPGYQFFLPHLSSAQSAKGKRRCRHLCRRRPRCAAGLVRSCHCPQRRPRHRHRGWPHRHQRGDRPPDDQSRKGG